MSKARVDANAPRTYFPEKLAAQLQMAREWGRDQNEGCFHLGEMYAAGLGVDRDEARATLLLDKACRGGHGLACSVVAARFEQGLGTRPDLVRTKAAHG